MHVSSPRSPSTPISDEDYCRLHLLHLDTRDVDGVPSRDLTSSMKPTTAGHLQRGDRHQFPERRGALREDPDEAEGVHHLQGEPFRRPLGHVERLFQHRGHEAGVQGGNQGLRQVDVLDAVWGPGRDVQDPGKGLLPFKTPCLASLARPSGFHRI